MSLLSQHILIKRCQVKMKIMLKCGGKYQSLLILPAAHATCMTADTPGNGRGKFLSFSTTYSLPQLCMSYFTSAKVNCTATQLSKSDCRVPSLQGRKLKMRQDCALQSTEWAAAQLHGLSSTLTHRAVLALNTRFPVPFQKLWIALLHTKNKYIQLPN